MKNGQIAIDEVHKDVVEREIFEVDFEMAERKKQPIKNAEAAVMEWVSATVKDTEALWEIPISNADNALGFGVAVSYIQNALDFPYSTAFKYRAYKSFS